MRKPLTDKLVYFSFNLQFVIHLIEYMNCVSDYNSYIEMIFKLYTGKVSFLVGPRTVLMAVAPLLLGQ